jgi:asparagine synthase (glutamine-hydrolysing)
MCGFAGFLSLTNADIVDHNVVLSAMANAITHRGPDDSGVWLHPNQTVGFSHRRLAIMDLSAAGHQPMASVGGRYTLVFNGEIYNHLELRQEIEKIKEWQWRGHSDTETILACFELFGFENTLPKLVGMFAIAVWDDVLQQLFLARDRLGEKPLYMGWCHQHLLFGSELKALRAHPAFDATIDRSALALFMRYSYVPAPKSIYASIQKLPAGCYAILSLARVGEMEVKKYWDIMTQVATTDFTNQSETEMIDALHQHLVRSVKSQMLADVPLGAFLSGGVDSSLIVGIMQSVSDSPVKTFTIGFAEQEFNEATYAADVARHLGTEHHQHIVTDRDTLAVIPKLAKMYDEPFADSSQIPTYLVCAMAREHVTVALSGDGGDELFAGYSRYPHVAAMWQRQQKMPKLVRRLLVSAMTLINPHTLNRLMSRLGIQSPGLNPGLKLSKAIAGLAADDFESYYQLFVTHFTTAQSLSLVNGAFAIKPADEIHSTTEVTPLEQMMRSDAANYMVDDILVKVDRASMAVSLETRVPMLDVKVVEQAFQMPLALKYTQGVGKTCLRSILDQYVPRSLFERPKKGFGVPLASWLRGALREWAESLIAPELIRQQGYLNADYVSKMWYEHQQGIADWHFQLWNILIFQDWLRNQQPQS